MIETLETVVQISAPTCRFEMLEGEWPKPIEFPTLSPKPILSTLFRAPSYHIEARLAGSRRRDFGVLGKTFILPADCEFVGRGTGGPVRVARCIFERDAYRALVGHDNDFTDAELDRAFDVSNQTVSLLMRRLMQEAANPGFASEALLEGIAAVLLVECGRHIYRDTRDDAGAQRGLSQRHLRTIERYLEECESGVPSISDLANLCGFSPHYFAKLFRQATGQSVGRYIADWRLRRAEQLLSETSLPLKEIAFRLGFANAANFSTAFSKEMRQTPGAYRRNMGRAPEPKSARLN
jgi:AraC family transcriptional regulator